VNINGAEATCPSCGAEYDVIRHGRRGDFSKSPEVSLDAVRKPTRMDIYVEDTAGKSIVGQTVTVGTIARVTSALWREPWYTSLGGKRHLIYHRLNTGAWETIKDATASSLGELTVDYTIPKAGKHTFYAEFLGDDTYLGCPSTVHGLLVSRDYSTSPEVSLEAQPALSVIVKDMIFRKPIVGARVVIDTFEALTDTSGMAVFDALTPGAYTLTVSAKDYKTTTRSVELTTAGMVVEVNLIHVAAIALGIVSAGAIGIVVVHQALKRK